MAVDAIQLLWMAVVAALLGGAAAVERKAAFQLMLSRPLVLAALLGWALGDARGGLFLGLPLELLFLGGVNLGGSLPDNETLLAAALVSMVVPAGIALGTDVDPELAALGLALLLPLGMAGRRLERASEAHNTALLEEALRRTEAGDPDAARLNLRGLFLPFVATAAICAACVLVSPVLAWVRLRCGGTALVALTGAWHAVWAVAAAAAIRAIRDPRAPIFAAAAALALVVATIASKGIP